ncbi:ferrochelatase [Pusillimonas caeni]|uniref:ferrochelatase n=1 Tax=Pusillimonas caeni TaxID=1348472 RepID=UPI000E59C36F|nr:ferrochelatase [Pusillimonas caeni]TFL13914.1 ferrochelatase [Pusillimonas caeni]
MSAVLPPRYLPEPADDQAFSDHPAPRAPGPTGVLLINLGTPDAPDAGAIRLYLAEFLSDPRVIELPQVLWQPILRGAILPLRPRKLAPRYREIWHERGSPLLVWSLAQGEAVGEALKARGARVCVEVAMRYGRPALPEAIEKLRSQGCERILAVPMYPQYAASTTATAVDAVAQHAARLRNQPELRFIKRFHDQPEYIDALAAQVERHWEAHGLPQKLLLSFHGLPRAVIEKGDPYRRDCMETAGLLAKRLGERGALVSVAFQSRFGAQKWLEPYTEPTLRAWAREGVRQVDVMCPGFLADCIETLEEIQMQCRDAFLSEGGERFGFIPCLNDDPQWARGFAAIIGRHLQGWGDLP